MKLIELKEKYSGRVKIGAKDGAAFFYCGRFDEFDADAVEERLTDRTTTLLKKANRSIVIAEENPPSWESYLRWVNYNQKRGKFKTKPSQTGFERWKAGEEEALQKKKEYAKRLRRKIENYPHIGEREVLDVYKSVCEKDTMIVIVNGREVGSAWTSDEYLEV